MIGATSAGEGRLTYIGVSMIDPISRGQAQRDSRARGARGGPSPEGIQLEVLSGAGVPAYYAWF